MVKAARISKPRGGKDGVKFQRSHFPVDTSFEKNLFMDIPIIGEELKKLKKKQP